MMGNHYLLNPASGGATYGLRDHPVGVFHLSSAHEPESMRGIQDLPVP
jgi:hypothetical protein